ncbi:MAG: FHA domain-containing protein [Deltaproteobacteria bacterium]|nr:FHA domain-containing protein [Deltaproteobacteria bacterium]
MFLLRIGNREIPLPQGGCVLGRGGDCQVVLDDSLASRKHAFLKVSSNSVTLQDLGSRNGVYVNGERVDGSIALRVGDEILIGQSQFVLQQGLKNEPPKVEEPKPRLRSSPSNTEDAIVHPPETIDTTGRRLDVTAHADLLGLLGTVADKSIAQGRPEQAERLLTRHLTQMLQAARGSRLTEPAEIELAAKQAMKLANATLKGEWIGYIFELYMHTKRVLPAPIIDALYEAVRKVKSIDHAPLQNYLSSIRSRTGELSAAERFLVQRTEGLERVAKSR